MNKNRDYNGFYVAGEGLAFLAVLLITYSHFSAELTDYGKAVFTSMALLAFLISFPLLYMFLRKTWGSRKAEWWMIVGVAVLGIGLLSVDRLYHSWFVSTSSFFITTGALLGDFLAKIFVVRRSSRLAQKKQQIEI